MTPCLCNPSIRWCCTCVFIQEWAHMWLRSCAIAGSDTCQFKTCRPTTERLTRPVGNMPVAVLLAAPQASTRVCSLRELLLSVPAMYDTLMKLP